MEEEGGGGGGDAVKLIEMFYTGCAPIVQRTESTISDKTGRTGQMGRNKKM